MDNFLKYKQEIKQSWFIPLRLTIFLLVFGAVFLSTKSSSELIKPFLFYSISTLVFLLFLSVKSRFVTPRIISLIIFTHIVIEFYAEAILLSGAEQLTSQYSILFLLTIVSASLVYRLLGTLSVATAASIIFTIAISLPDFSSGIHTIDFEKLISNLTNADHLFYTIFLNLCTFYLVAFISGYLAERLRVKEGELSSASEMLERAQLDTDDILFNLHSGLLSLDNRGRIVYFNRAAETILGVEERYVRGKSFLDIFGKKMPAFSAKLLSILKKSKPSIRTEVEITSADGKKIPLGLTTSILGDERVGIRGVIAIFSDLTNAKKMERDLMKADRLAVVGELSAAIAHEIRNPLAAISGSVEVLREELKLEDENSHLMQLIVKESQRLSRILEDFLSYTRMKPAMHDKVELVSLIDETVELLKNSSNISDKVALNFETVFTTAYLVADENQLKHVLINLLTNAFEAVDDRKGKIEIWIGEPANAEEFSPVEWVNLRIIDNGCGFAPEFKEKIYEPFFSQKKRGTGLGLAIVSRCIENLGAHIYVESLPENGTTFSILLRKYLSPVNNIGKISVKKHSPKNKQTAAEISTI